MAQEENKPSGPDLSQGVAIADLAGGKLLGHVGDEDVLLVQSGGEIFAVGAHCTHYHVPLAEGLVVGETVRCPWHHACFDLRTGEAARAPALSPISCWNVERRAGRVFVKEKRAQPKPRGKPADGTISIASIDVGGGTTDLIVNAYRLEGAGTSVTLFPEQKFREGFNVAGDDILLRVVQSHVLPPVEALPWLASTTVEGPTEEAVRQVILQLRRGTSVQ